MREYISRETLRDLMYTEAFDRDTGLQRWDSGLWIRFKLFENCLDAIPAADVRPVAKAEWVWMSSTYDRTPCEMRYECSACHHETISQGHEPWEKFCPNCGAVMDGGQDDV